MKQSMFFVVALALCALPSVLGLSCYSCTPNQASGQLCNTMGSLSMVNCTNENDTHCVTVTVMSSLLPNTYIYSFGCSNGSACPDYNTTACQLAMMQGNVTSCNTECCQGDNCNTLPVMPTATSDMPEPSVTATQPPVTTPTSAGDKLHVYFGLLFIILMTLVWQ